MPRVLRGVLAAVLLSGVVVAVPSHAAAYGSAQRSYVVPTRRGLIYLEVVHPTLNGRIVKAPEVLTYSPYSVLGRNGDASTYTALGIARAYADVVGTGNSGGCYDYGGNGEKQSGYDVVEWLAKQKWSTAVTRPPHLVTIVPQAAISRWYDYAYSGGVRYTDTNEDLGHEGPGAVTDEGADTPLGFDFGFAIPPPADVTDPGWAARVASTTRPCQEVEHTLRGYSLTPDYDAFWQERDYAKDAHLVRIPVMVALNWGDWNVKQDTGLRFYEQLTHSVNRKLYAGTRWEGHGPPSTKAYDEARLEWLQHYLLGERTDAPGMPAVTSQTSDFKGPMDYRTGAFPATRPLRLYPSASGVLARKAGKSADASFAMTGTVTESDALASPRSPGRWLWFESAPLSHDVRVFGRPTVRLWSTAYRSWVTLAVVVVDVDAASRAAGVATDPQAMIGVTRGWLDSRYRFGLGRQVALPAGKASGIDVVAKPTDYTFRAEHRIGLLVTSETLDWAIAKPPGDCAGPECGRLHLQVGGARTYVSLPVVGAPRL
jgi:X-Pro dipeptidyl-peptidase